MILFGSNELVSVIFFSTTFPCDLKIPWSFIPVILTASPFIDQLKSEESPNGVRTHSERRPNLHLLTYWHQVGR